MSQISPRSIEVGCKKNGWLLALITSLSSLLTTWTSWRFLACKIHFFGEPISSWSKSDTRSVAILALAQVTFCAVVWRSNLSNRWAFIGRERSESWAEERRCSVPTSVNSRSTPVPFCRLCCDHSCRAIGCVQRWKRKKMRFVGEFWTIPS